MFKIKKYSAVENAISMVIGLLLALTVLWTYLWVTVTEEPKQYVMPEYEYVQVQEPEVYVEEHIDYDLNNLAIMEELVAEEETTTNKLNKKDGVFYGPSGKETYYNLPMKGVIKLMRKHGYTEQDYPYIEREDGVRCLGDYVIVAGSLDKYKKGEIIPTSLGLGIICDTGKAVTENPDMIDIAVNW